MQCPVILLADPDAKYLRPLELKFLEELSGRIDLEIITDIDYFKQYFSQPKTVEVLIIDEKWYHESLEQHNIDQIFVLTDSCSEIESKRTIQYIFKYSSSNEIYNTVIRSMKGMSFEQKKDRETKVVVITSGSGGTGKTTIALGIAANLASRMQRVLYIDVEHVNTFQYWLKDCVPMNAAVYSNLQKDRSGLYSHIKAYMGQDDFSYIPPFKAALVTLGISMSFYRTLINEAKESGDYDVIVVDTEAVFDEDKAFLMTYADTLIMVVNQTPTSVYTMNELLKNIRIDSSDKYLFVCNNFEEHSYNALISPQENHKFIVNEYVHHIDEYEKLSLDDLKNNRDIQKLSYLLM